MLLNLRNGKDAGGRPKIAECDKRVFRIPLQVSHEEKEEIKQRAYKMNMNVNQFIRYLIREAFKELEL